MLNAEQITNAGNKLFNAGHYPEALEKYNEAISIDPECEAAWINKALAHKKLNQIEAALNALDQLLEINHQHVKALYQKTSILFQQGHYRDAQILYSKVLELDEQHFDANMGLFLCNQQINAKVILAVADLKLTENNEVKILEFGNYFDSDCSGYENLTKEKILDNLKNNINLPPLLLALDSSDQSKFAYDNNVHLQQTELQATNPVFSVQEIHSHRAIYAGWALKQLEKDVLILGDTTMEIIFGNKTLTHDSFVAAKLEHLRPKTFKIPRTSQTYNPSLIEEIKQTMPNATQFVIKAPDMSCGNGVIVILRKELDIILDVLLSEKKDLINKIGLFSIESLVKKYNSNLGYMYISSSTHYLVEEYIPNKPILYNDKKYDATMRFVFAFTQDNIEDKKIYPLGFYWKLPPKSIESTGELRDRCVSSYTANHCLAAKVSEEDQKIVFENLQVHLPVLFSSMLQQNIFDLAKKDFHLNEISHSWKLVAKSTSEHGYFNLAKHAFEQDKDRNFYYYLYLGKHYYLLTDYQEAITNFSTAISMVNQYQLAEISAISEAYFMRGISYFMHNISSQSDDEEIYEKIESDFSKAEIDKSYECKIDSFLQTQENQLQKIAETKKFSIS